ncbi:HD domain protein [Nitrincola lacisaponensis]|uniref:HD domain protein n=1 Tax=Nitrincola lacisaponensis TaxID=267850 RepID=A0A063Y8A7_9GAMM|nr:flagellar brake protein [Nitrincola lacisaponensis]KDE40622.1 HD domain protein [Nitrincola lacisaponensis]
MSIQAPEGQLITSAREIRQMLVKLSETATPITIQPQDSENRLTTYLASIQSEQGIMCFDMPLPQQRHVLLKNRNLTLTTRLNGCLLTLSDVRLSPIEDVAAEAGFQAAIPSQLHFLQRRRSFRAPVRPLLDIFASLPFVDELPVTGLLKDLSAEGCRIELSGDRQADFSQLSEPLPLTLSFPDSSSFNANLRIMRSHYDPVKQRTDLGCSFESLQTVQQQQLTRLVADLQRDYINHLRHGGHPSGTPAVFVPSEHRVMAGQAIKSSPPPAESVKPVPTPVDSMPIDIRRAHQSAISAIKGMIVALRSAKTLPLDQAEEAAQHLLQAWRQDRQGILLLSRLRDADTYLFQHSVSFALSLVDTLATQYGDQLKPALLEQLMLGGLFHELSRALLPGGIQQTDLEGEPEQRSIWMEQQLQLIETLSHGSRLSVEAIHLVRDSHERLDGSGLLQRGDAQLNRVSRLAATLYALERLSQCWYNCDWHYHPLRAFKMVAERTAEFHAPSVRLILKQQGKYPLGSAVQLNNQMLGLVMRQDEQRQPTHLRLVYNLKFNSLIPPKDLCLTDQPGLYIERPVNPLRFEIGASLLKMPLRDAR